MFHTGGIHLTDISKALPDFAIEAIREAIPAFEKKIKEATLRQTIINGR